MTSKYGRFFQLGYVVRDMDAAIASIQARTGAKVIDLEHDFRDAKGNPKSIEALAHLHMPGAELELIKPRPGFDTIYDDYLPDQAEGMSFHHIGYLLPDVESYEAIVAEVEGAKTPIPMRADYPNVRYIYADTRPETGHYSELIFRVPGFPARDIP